MKLIPIEYECVGMVDDVPLTNNRMCLKFECQEWRSDVAVAPELIQGRCPKCGCSYGASA